MDAFNQNTMKMFRFYCRLHTGIFQTLNFSTPTDLDAKNTVPKTVSIFATIPQKIVFRRRHFKILFHFSSISLIYASSAEILHEVSRSFFAQKISINLVGTD